MYKNYDIHTGEMLQERFPYMFNKPNIGFSFYRGWMPVAAGLCVNRHQICSGCGLLSPRLQLTLWTVNWSWKDALRKERSG
jgi:hypothetical protein